MLLGRAQWTEEYSVVWIAVWRRRTCYSSGRTVRRACCCPREPTRLDHAAMNSKEGAVLFFIMRTSAERYRKVFTSPRVAQHMTTRRPATRPPHARKSVAQFSWVYLAEGAVGMRSTSLVCAKISLFAMEDVWSMRGRSPSLLSMPLGSCMWWRRWPHADPAEGFDRYYVPALCRRGWPS